MDYITASVTQFYFWNQDREGLELIVLRVIRQSRNPRGRVDPIIATIRDTDLPAKIACTRDWTVTR